MLKFFTEFELPVNFDRQQLAKALQQCQQQSQHRCCSLDSFCHSTRFPAAFDVHLFEQVDSTNSRLWALLQQGAAAGTAVIALRQQAGRGQRGRQWSSPAGGLYLSLALAPTLPADQSGLLIFSSAWGIAQALRDRQLPVQLKWPNDLVVDRQKLGGILVETRIQAERIRQVVIGVGINWSNRVPEGGITVQSLQQTAPTAAAIASLEELAAIVLCGLQQGYQVWQQQGAAALLAAYEALLVNVGQRVDIDGAVAEVVGVCPNGDLRVQLQPPGSTAVTEVCLTPTAIRLGYGR